MDCPKCGKKMKRTWTPSGYTYVCWNEDCPDYVGRPARDWSEKKMSKSKLELIIEEIGKRQMDRFREKSVKHNPGTESDLVSDNFNWDLDSAEYWKHEIEYHVGKWKATAETDSNGREPNAILDLINVLVCRLHKLEVDAEKPKKVQ